MTLSAGKNTRCLWAGPAALLTTNGQNVGAGLDDEVKFRSVPARWGIISLDIPLYRTKGLTVRVLLDEPRIRSNSLLNSGAADGERFSANGRQAGNSKI